MHVWHGPTGRLVQGNVLDVNKRAFDRALRQYDPLLYTVWNPKKLRGWGCWEIRRRPTKKTALYRGTHKGVQFYQLVELEFDMVHHVLDCAFLNYDAIRKLKEIDVFAQVEREGYKSFEDVLAKREEAYRTKIEQDAREALKYALKQNKSAARDFYELVRSGISPAQILTSISWSK